MKEYCCVAVESRVNALCFYVLREQRVLHAQRPSSKRVGGVGLNRKPRDGYFMYDFRRMSDQQSDEKATPGILCLYFRLNSIEPEILKYQILCSVRSRTTNIPSTRREWSTATSGSIIIIAFEELNDETAATPCFTPRIPPASLSTITIYTHEDRSVCEPRIYQVDITKIKIHSSRCGIEDFVETHLCKLCVILRSRVLYFGFMHVVAEAASVRACQLLRREHASNIWPSLCWPSMLG